MCPSPASCRPGSSTKSRRRPATSVSSRWWRARSCAPATTPTKWCRPMQVPVIMPDLGMPDAVVSAWLVDEGGEVEEGESLIEILAGPATFEVIAPASGRLADRLALTADSVLPGQTLGHIESSFISDERLSR